MRLILPVLLFAAAALAQNNAASTNRAAATDATTTADSKPTVTTPASQATDTKTTDKPTDAKTTALSNLPDLSSATDSSADSSDSAATTTGSVFQLTGLPTIAGYGIPTAVVPWTAGAPFMQKSSLPEGTVFIAVGSVLGALAFAVFLWRGIVAWQLHRSVRRADDTTYPEVKKSRSHPYAAAPPGSNMSLDRLGGGPAHKPARVSKHHAPSPSSASGAPRSSNLFFSPTAGAGTPNRASTLMPAGYYASPATGTPAAGASMVHLGSSPGTPLSSLNPLGPARNGYAPQRNFGPSPPGSPVLRLACVVFLMRWWVGSIVEVLRPLLKKTDGIHVFNQENLVVGPLPAGLAIGPGKKVKGLEVEVEGVGEEEMKSLSGWCVRRAVR
ncbi:hypothetical protein EJ06DRAFT_546046 [Trichodelitschia bisporula]|uniref:Uncharacterized protein n=1 Tax=Trichodelitschia bisporula TaxID=703511 RepID=A0A6G1IC13_9PEZI|nr:hypothetical protein EJ06DRAFT_546046 [Trichodelitschia bisporula]